MKEQEKEKEEKENKDDELIVIVCNYFMNSHYMPTHHSVIGYNSCLETVRCRYIKPYFRLFETFFQQKIHVKMFNAFRL